MQQEQSGNPALSKKAMERVMAVESASHATVGGTVVKTLILVLLVMATGVLGWRAVGNVTGNVALLLIGSSIAALVFALIASFVPKSTPITAPLYALAEGFLLGAISRWANDAYGNIVVQAIALTGVIFFSTLFLYQTRIIKVTEKLRAVILIATLGVVMYYVLAFFLSLFGVTAPLIWDSGTFGIVFSLVVIFIAALNLLLDFNFVETAAASKAPKVFEWYGAFGLMVTLIWLYLEILRLLGKVRG
ncbi:MAG: Bax inhibitor-1/YccA family protein [Candidatus Saccharimonadales bacterium]